MTGLSTERPSARGGPRVAVVGMDCLLPDASDPDSLWEMLMRGEHGIGDAPSGRWSQVEGLDLPPAGYVDDPAGFDAGFFGLSPVEAAGMDPQQRMLLECTWRALEDAGIAPASLAGSRTAVHVGMMSSDWTALTVGAPTEMTPQLGMGAGYCMAANRISYHLDLRGPSMTVDTACSSSLVAFQQAAEAVRSGMCDVAVAAGVNIMLTPALSSFYSRAGLAAPDGQCKPFSARADGIGRGEGVGVVVLRRLDDEVAASGLAYAEVLGGSVGHDGRSNGLTAPSRGAQVSVVRDALTAAGVEPSEVTFVEGHGTGTTLGDMMEVGALGEIFAGRTTPCLLGSIKGNLGHLEGAAGIAAVIKTCLALSRRTLPASRHCRDENPALRLSERGLAVASSPTRLRRDGIAGVSSFGMGGTLAHVLLGAVRGPRRGATGPSRPGVVVVSADGAGALSANAARLAQHLERVGEEEFGAVCRASAALRAGKRTRLAAAAGDRDQAVRELRRRVRDLPTGGPAARRQRPSVAFLYTGQGSLAPGVAGPAARAWEPFAVQLEATLRLLPSELAPTVRRLLLGPTEPDDAALLERDAGIAQPAMFVLQHALTAAFADVGVRPAAVLGHSIGEFAAACASGHLTPAEAARLVCARGAAMRDLPGTGTMLAVRAPAAVVRERLGGRTDLVVAVDNGPTHAVLAGTHEAVAAASAELAEFEVRPLRVTHAFHSPLVEAAGNALSDAEHGRGTPTVAFHSTSHGSHLPDGPEPGYWSDQVGRPVRFREALAGLLATDPTHLVEIGPRAILTSLAAEQGGGSLPRLVPVPGDRATGLEFGATLARLFEGGVQIDWTALETAEVREERHAVHRLPGYEFDHHRVPLPLYPPGAGVIGRDAPSGLFDDDPGALSTVSRSTVSRSSVPRTGTAATAPEATTRRGEPATATRDDIHVLVLALLGEVAGFEESELPGDARLREDLGLDSLLAVELGDRLRERLGRVDLSITEFVDSLDTVDSLVAYAHRLTEETP